MIPTAAIIPMMISKSKFMSIFLKIKNEEPLFLPEIRICCFMENNIEITTNRSRINLDYVHHYLSEKLYWAKGIPKEVVEKSIQNSICFSVFLNEKQIGFARVITDHATFAYLGDVFIDEDFRGLGFSKKIMQFILDYTDLQGLRRWMLMTWDAQSLYEQFGFSVSPKPEQVMEISVKDVYQKT